MSRSLCVLGLVLLLPSAAPSADGPPSQAEGEKYFEAHVRPVLQTHCVSCHGAAKPKGGLSLTTRDALLKGGDSGEAISINKPATSLLLKVVSHEGEVKMPPKGKLAPAQINALTKWVEMGAPWPA